MMTPVASGGIAGVDRQNRAGDRPPSPSKSNVGKEAEIIFGEAGHPKSTFEIIKGGL
jgi:hypothetical protein